MKLEARPVPDFSKKDVGFKDIKEYLSLRSESDFNIGKMSLRDIQKGFQSDDAQFASLKRELVKEREKELSQETLRYQQKQIELRRKREKEEQEILSLIKELEEAKKEEIRARVEREEVQQSLRGIEKVRSLPNPSGWLSF